MHNIRKIKRKKKTKIINPEDLAQQKLFEISRFQDQEQAFNEVDLFIKKLQPKNIKSETQIAPKNKNKVPNRTFADFYSNQFERTHKKNVDCSQVADIHTHSLEIIGKKPLALSNFDMMQLTTFCQIEEIEWERPVWTTKTKLTPQLKLREK